MARLHDERGAIAVMFALSLPAILLFGSFIVDTANWWEHKRHLQMQADAAALAGAGLWGVPCSPDAIEAEARRYAGMDDSLYNHQVGDAAERIEIELNSKTWPLQQSPVDDTVVEGDPCPAAMVDVKLTETDTPWLFGLAPALGIDGPEFINAHARASIVKIDTLGGALPIGVPEVNPKRGKVQFFDEDTGTVLGEAAISPTGASDGTGTVRWLSDSASVAVGDTTKNIGMRVILSGGNSLECGQPLVDCIDTSPDDIVLGDGLLYFRGIPNASAGDAPKLKSVGLQRHNCSDAYFTYAEDSAPCLIGLSAEIDFGPDYPVDDLDQIDVTATRDGSNKSFELEYDPASGMWALPDTGSLIPIDDGEGDVPIQLSWVQTTGTRGTATCTTKEKCSGTFEMVQRPFAGSDGLSGPVRGLKVYEDGALWSIGNHSLTEGVHQLVVEVSLQASFADAKAIDAPVVALRVGADSGSNGQALDCDVDPKWGLVEEMQFGCRDTYTINQGTACANNKAELETWDQPWPCVATQPGGKVAGQIAEGLNLRILGERMPTSCTHPNRWKESFVNGFDAADPRIVQVFLTPFGVFGEEGKATVPVTNFATFYVTGWGSNGGFNNPCTPLGDEPDTTEPGFIYGRFIKYVQQLPSGSGTEKCDPNSFGACTMVLTE